MKPFVVCYLPVAGGLRFDEQTWGLADIASQLADSGRRTLAIVVHAGIEQDQLAALPFDEVHHSRLTIDQWHSADAHLDIFRRVTESLKDFCDIYLFSAKPFYQEIAVRASAHGGLITNASEAILPKGTGMEELVVKREIYYGKANEFVRFKDTPERFVSFDPAYLYGNPQKGYPHVTEIHHEEKNQSALQYVSSSTLNWKEMDLAKAACVIGIGRGVFGTDCMDDIHELAELLNAPIGGSKVADELGLTPRDKRIGSSGSAIHADIYIAIGISGSSQHLAGIKEVKHIVAINLDSAAPIFQHCHVGIIGDAGEVVRMLVKSLQEERQSEKLDEDLRAG